MPNPRITFRVTPELLEKLPIDAEERSHLLRRLLEDYFTPKHPESELANLKVRVEALERKLGDEMRVQLNSVDRKVC